jgi:hypothetical protein
MSGMASDRSDDIDHLDFETPRDLDRRFNAAQSMPRATQQPAPVGDDFDDDPDDGPTRLPGHHVRRAVVILVALLLLVALFLSSGVLGLFRPVQAPTEGGERGVNASGSTAPEQTRLAPHHA